MKKTIIFLSAIIVLSTLGFVRTVEASEPVQLSETIKSFVDEKKGGTASVSLGVFQNGKPLYQKQYGYIDEENKHLTDKEAIYEWGSVSKVLVWISLMQLQESGQIDLTKDIKAYLPQDFAEHLNYSHPIRLLDIMNLQAGFEEVGLKVEFEENEAIPELPQLLIDSQPEQVFQPGTVTAYNNWTPALAAYVVESVSGQAFYDYVQKNIFKPLGMEHTAVAADWNDNLYVKEKRPRSKCYNYTSEAKDSLGSCILHIGLYPAGATAGTFDDFFIFAMEFTKEHPRFFKKAETFAQMKEASVLYSDSLARIHHGLLSIDDVKHLIGHSGNTQGFTSSFWFDPNTQTGYAVMTNEPGETAYNYGFASLLFGKNKPKTKKSPDISGLFTSQRSIHRGALRFTKYLAGILPILKTDQEGVFHIPLADMTVTYLGNHRYYLDNGNGLAYQITEKDQGQTLEDFTTDRQRLSLVEIFVAYGLVIAVLLVPIAMVIRILYRLIQHFRGKHYKVNMPGLVSHIAVTLVSIAFIYLWLFSNSYSKIQIFVVSGICVLSSGVIIVNFCWQLYNTIKGEGYSLKTVTWPLFIPVFVWFFQLYNFWL